MTCFWPAVSATEPAASPGGEAVGGGVVGHRHTMASRWSIAAAITPRENGSPEIASLAYAILVMPRPDLVYRDRVIVTGALLAESATVVNNKLNVVGGVLDTYRAGVDRHARATLVVLTQAEPFDRAPNVDLKVTDPSGESREIELVIPPSSLGGEIGFACFPVGIPVPVDGRYLLSVSTQAGSVSLPLNVES